MIHDLLPLLLLRLAALLLVRQLLLPLLRLVGWRLYQVYYHSASHGWVTGDARIILESAITNQQPHQQHMLLT